MRRIGLKSNVQTLDLAKRRHGGQLDLSQLYRTGTRIYTPRELAHSERDRGFGIDEEQPSFVSRWVQR